MFRHMATFSPDNFKERLSVVAVNLAVVMAVRCIIVNPFPTTVGAHNTPLFQMLLIEWAHFHRSAVSPLNSREVNCIFMTVDFHCLSFGIDTINMISETARVHSPSICFWFTMNNIFRQQFSRTTSLDDSKCKYASFISIWYTRHRPYIRQSIWCVWNWPVHHPCDAP